MNSAERKKQMNERCITQKDRYSPENLMYYKTAVAIAENMEKEGLLSPCDRKKIVTALTKKYGFDSGSIFAA